MKLRDTVADLADSLELPEEAVSDAMREVSAAAGRVRILGTELTLHAMDRDTLIVTGRIAAVEYA